MTDRIYKGDSIYDSISDYTVIDLETTGKYITSCEIIEMAAVKVRDSKIVDTFTQLVKPSHDVPKEVSELTGISQDMLKDAPDISSAIENYINFIGDDIIVRHNITTFDANLIYDCYLACCGKAFKNAMLDTYHFSRRCDIDVPDYKLTTIASHLGIEYANAHRALSDCIANFRCYELLKDRYAVKPKAQAKTIKKKVQCADAADFAQALDTNIDFAGKKICLTGEFEHISRTAAASALSNLGATMQPRVTSKTDYLVVGGKGSEKWLYGSYGQKVEKALELQKKGYPIKIFKEEAIFSGSDT